LTVAAECDSMPQYRVGLVGEAHAQAAAGEWIRCCYRKDVGNVLARSAWHLDGRIGFGCSSGRLGGHMAPGVGREQLEPLVQLPERLEPSLRRLWVLAWFAGAW
jgi:hypothetical protein